MYRPSSSGDAARGVSRELKLKQSLKRENNRSDCSNLPSETEHRHRLYIPHSLSEIHVGMWRVLFSPLQKEVFYGRRRRFELHDTATLAEDFPQPPRTGIQASGLSEI